MIDRVPDIDSSSDKGLKPTGIKGQVEQKNDDYDKTRTSWLNRALRDYEAVYWVSIGHYEALEAVAVGN